MINKIKQKIISAYNWVKEKILWFLIGGIAIAGVVALPEEPKTIGELIQNNEPTYFAELDENNEVLRVIVADQEFINTLDNPNDWKQTYYNSEARKNYAGIGYKYNKDLDAFISKRPNENAVLDVETAKWILPKIEIINETPFVNSTSTPQ